MRLLHTGTGAFHWFDDPEDVAYAAVSYVWSEDEQSYQDILNIQSSTSTANQESTVLPDPRLSSTIRHACKIAADAGHQYLWLPHCSTNTTSSAEQSTFLNAQWEWYARARVCLAYLPDVAPTDPPRKPHSQFRASTWHTDARTLPALLAPASLVFLARDWSVLGTKITLAAALADATGVDRAVLRGDVRVQDVSVARRMWWAARRQGNAAYALLLAGLFGVRADAGWGEGPWGFVRLQEEIARTSNDQSIFAWHYHRGHAHPDGLFAFGPCCFARSGGVSPITPDVLAARLGLVGELGASLPCAQSPSALTMRLPLIPHHIETYPPTTALYEVFGVAARFEYAAVLQCADERGRLVVLTLDRPPSVPLGGGDGHVVKAVETPLGQCDRVWSCPKSLLPYRDAVVVADVEILRESLQTPWIQPVSPSAPQGSVILDPACRTALEEQGYDVAHETHSQELVDDLYKRSHRARILADVHHFVLSPRPRPIFEGAPHAARINVELIVRRHSLAPIPVERISVHWEGATGEHAAVRLEFLRWGNTAPTAARYAVGSQPGAVQVLSLHLSRRPDVDDMHFLKLELAELDSRPEPLISPREPIDEATEETARIAHRSPALPRLPSIRGWTSRRNALVA